MKKVIPGQCKNIHPNRIDQTTFDEIEDHFNENWMENWVAYVNDSRNDPPNGFSRDNGKDTILKDFPEDEIDERFKDCTKQLKDLMTIIKKNRQRPFLLEDILQDSSNIDLGSMEKNTDFKKLVNLALG